MPLCQPTRGPSTPNNELVRGCTSAHKPSPLRCPPRLSIFLQYSPRSVTPFPPQSLILESSHSALEGFLKSISPSRMDSMVDMSSFLPTGPTPINILVACTLLYLSLYSVLTYLFPLHPIPQYPQPQPQHQSHSRSTSSDLEALSTSTVPTTPDSSQISRKRKRNTNRELRYGKKTRKMIDPHCEVSTVAVVTLRSQSGRK